MIERSFLNLESLNLEFEGRLQDAPTIFESFSLPYTPYRKERIAAAGTRGR